MKKDLHSYNNILSRINAAPVFWILIGLGIVMNYKAKTFMDKKRKRYSRYYAEKQN
jgi:hypothetical protein